MSAIENGPQRCSSAGRYAAERLTGLATTHGNADFRLLGGSPEADCRQIAPAALVADDEIDFRAWLASNESIWRGAPGASMPPLTSLVRTKPSSNVSITRGAKGRPFQNAGFFRYWRFADKHSRRPPSKLFLAVRSCPDWWTSSSLIVRLGAPAPSISKIQMAARKGQRPSEPSE
jgi:hypothetical protein